MTSPREQELYFKARNKSLERMVEGREFRSECLSAFLNGLETAEGYTSGTSSPLEKVLSDTSVETNIGFCIVAGMLTKLEAVKGKGYQASWMRRGNESVLHNIQRKYDLIEARLSGNHTGESLVTNLADLAVYCIKEMTRQAELDLEGFRKWVEEVRSLAV
jgi:hypothetical protein